MRASSVATSESWPRRILARGAALLRLLQRLRSGTIIHEEELEFLRARLEGAEALLASERERISALEQELAEVGREMQSLDAELMLMHGLDLDPLVGPSSCATSAEVIPSTPSTTREVT
jgi:hypothetical protein